MLHRTLAVFIVLFFVLMNALLIRWEYGGRSQLRSPVPTAMVWQKVLTAPDNSSLDILHRGKKIGHCTWVPALGEEQATGKVATDDVPPEGMVQGLAGYSLDLEGNVNLGDVTSRLRFHFLLKLSANQAWQEVSIKLTLRPSTWEVRALAAEQTVQINIDDDAGKSQRTFTVAELQQPDKILREFGGPFLPELLEGMGLPLKPGRPSATNQAAAISLGLDWEARNDWLKIGHDRMRVFRLQARLLGNLNMLIYVSPVGEILRVELPGELVLLNRLDGIADLEVIHP